MSNVNTTLKTAKHSVATGQDFHFTWFPYLPSFLCYIPAIAMFFTDEESLMAGLTLILAGSGLSILASLIVRLRKDQLELRQELHAARQALFTSQNTLHE